MTGNRRRLVRCHACGGDYYGWNDSGLCSTCTRNLGDVVGRVRVTPFRPRSSSPTMPERATSAAEPADVDPFEGL